MSHRILFVASLHHPETLQRERHTARQNNISEPLFPNSTALRFWENVLRQRGHTVEVFYRNLPARQKQDISAIKADKYTNRITPRRIMQAVMHRLPYEVNLELRQRNQNLIEAAQRFQPTHLWMVGDNRVIHGDTLATIKAQTGCKVLQSTGTSPIVFSHAIERQAAPLYDLVIANDFYHGVQWLELGAKEMLCLPVVAIDPEFHYPRDYNPELSADVGFVGTLVPDNLYSERVEALEALTEFDLGIWTIHDAPSSLQPYVRGSALGETMLQVLSSCKISLNVHGNFMRYGGNMRLFEAASVGAFQIVDNRDGISDWFADGDHLIIFEDLADLRDKMAYYLAHDDERQQIADSAREHVLKHHTYEQRLRQLEDVKFF